MYVAAARINLHIPASQSLKDRRAVIRSLSDRVRGKFGAAVADVGGQDTWQIAVVGVCVVSGTMNHAQERLDEAIRFIEGFSPEALVTAVEADVIPFEE
jgi:uncharacterized protein YlxP (DUF503 family)